MCTARATSLRMDSTTGSARPAAFFARATSAFFDAAALFSGELLPLPLAHLLEEERELVLCRELQPPRHERVASLDRVPRVPQPLVSAEGVCGGGGLAA
mgnify:CR=1 FL=1